MSRGCFAEGCETRLSEPPLKCDGIVDLQGILQQLRDVSANRITPGWIKSSANQGSPNGKPLTSQQDAAGKVICENMNLGHDAFVQKPC